MTCADAVRVIAAALGDAGGVGLEPLDDLVAHIERCAACAAEAEAQMLVQRVLRATPMLPLPAGAAARLRARLDREAAAPDSTRIDWRVLTLKAMRLVPGAACLLAIAAVLHYVVGRSSTGDVSAMIAEWGRDEIRSWHSPDIDAGASDRRALGLLLIDARHDIAAAGNR